eukprot:13094905-Alexandrium_andersonii.AAC.1
MHNGGLVPRSGWLPPPGPPPKSASGAGPPKSASGAGRRMRFSGGVQGGGSSPGEGRQETAEGGAEA